MNFACVAALAVSAAGCSGSVTDGINSGQWFAKPMTIVTRADGSDAAVNNFDLGPRGPVAPEDFVSADGQCGARIIASGDPTAPGAVDQGAGLVGGGIALAMSECDVVRRAGTPGNVAIAAGDGGERRVTLTYLSGPWPGIYDFSGGRLREISAAPVQQKVAVRPAAKKKAVAPPRAPRATPAPVIR